MEAKIFTKYSKQKKIRIRLGLQKDVQVQEQRCIPLILKNKKINLTSTLTTLNLWFKCRISTKIWSSIVTIQEYIMFLWTMAHA